MTESELRPSPERITSLALDNFYDQLASRDDMIKYFYDEMMIELPRPLTRDALADAIDTDIRDLIKNANLDLIFDATMISELDDDQFESLSDHLRDTFDATMIADALLARSIDA